MDKIDLRYTAIAEKEDGKDRVITGLLLLIFGIALLVVGLFLLHQIMPLVLFYVFAAILIAGCAGSVWLIVTGLKDIKMANKYLHKQKKSTSEQIQKIVFRKTLEPELLTPEPEFLKSIVWKWDKDTFVPYCPYCDELVYEKDHCVFCQHSYEWVDPEKPASGGWPSADIALLNSGKWTIHLPNPDFKRVYLLKNNRLLMTAPCNKKMTRAELLQFLSDNVERLEKRYQELYPEG